MSYLLPHTTFSGVTTVYEVCKLLSLLSLFHEILLRKLASYGIEQTKGPKVV